MRTQIKFSTIWEGLNQPFTIRESIIEMKIEANWHSIASEQSNTETLRDIRPFTGKQDKNGKDLFDFDIVLWKDGSEDPDHWRYAVIFYEPKTMCYHFRIVKCGNLKKGYVFGNNFSCYDELEKVGNVYQNPEFL